jgi:hypothetical protein
LMARPAVAGKSAHAVAAADVVLDGNDWRMGSYEFDAGVKAGAQSENFNDSAFRAVTVPGTHRCRPASPASSAGSRPRT